MTHLLSTSRVVFFNPLALAAALMLGAAGPLHAQDDTRRMEAALARSLLTLDAIDSTSRDNGFVSLLTDDALFYIDPATQAVVPLTAASYDFVDDTTLDIVLRDDVLFHDGSTMTADDVVYTFSAYIDPDSELRRAHTYRRWISSVEKLDDLTVRMHLAQPDPMVLQYLAVDGKTVKAGTYGEAGARDWKAQATGIVGNGPYRVVSFEPGQELVLERFADYRAGSPKGMPEVGQIRFRVIPDYSTQAAEIISGNLDWANDVPTDIAEQAASFSEDVNFMSAPSMRIGYIILDAKGRTGEDAPTTDVKVRQALSEAIDRDLIAQQLVGGSAKAALTPCLPIQFGCAQDVPTHGYNPDHARALLKEAGYEDGFDLEVWSSRAGTKEILEAVVSMWRDVGVRANLRFVESSALTKARDEGQLAAYFDNNGSQGLADVNALLPNQFIDTSPNDFHGDPAVYDLLGKLTSTLDPQARSQIARETVALITDEVYWIPLYEFSANFLLSPRIDYPQADDGMQRLFLTTWKN
ncbi:ABC transporter substrate-binding protein [Cereibacter changlensis]|nr:ABC transporter substrate-binding protein [Cereibacter changlensis]